MENLEIVAAAGAIYGFMSLVAVAGIKTKRRRSHWVKPWILNRPLCGAYTKLFSDLLQSDEASFCNFIRMDLSAFDDLLHYIEWDINRKIRLEKYAVNEHVHSRRILRA